MSILSEEGDKDILWFKDAIVYQLHVKSFFDYNGDGIGDLRGLLEKLDYLKNLGVTAIWLLPFYPSPLKDDGYDISGYMGVHPDYGNLKDFRRLLKEVHSRGMRVITELILNHTSDQHPWFQKARRARPGSAWRNYYVWSGTAERYKDARIIFQDFETSNWSWDPVAGSYFWHRFYSHQPDLNFENPQVRKAMVKVLDFWLDMGVDGLRLDAVPYLFEREGTNCENLSETHDFLKSLRSHVDTHFPGTMLLAEANQWPEDAVAYFGQGEECHMAFHFPIMPRIFMSIQMEDRFPLVDILDQTPHIPDICQWAMFLRNHDELTLEMVTDEERDYMYRVFARERQARINLGIRRRLAPLMGNNRRKIELINVILLSLPGTPVIYYGDEIGMGDNYFLGDRNGVRTPMQWSADRNAGFSRANPQKLFLPPIIDPQYHFEVVNVENQETSQSSLLWWTKRILTTRKRFRAFGRGQIEILAPENPKILAFIRHWEDEIVLVVANLSGFSQVVELDLFQYAGLMPEEIVSGNSFPQIKERPYLLTIGPHDYFWFLLAPEKDSIEVSGTRDIPELKFPKWEDLLFGISRKALEEKILPAFLQKCRWFGSKSRSISRVSLTDHFTLKLDSHISFLTFTRVQFTEGSSETYLLPLSLATGDGAFRLREDHPDAVISKVVLMSGEGVLYDGVHDENFREKLLHLLIHSRMLKGEEGRAFSGRGTGLKGRVSGPSVRSQLMKLEQSNTSIRYGKKLVLKLFRKLEEGLNPEKELAGFLSKKAAFLNVPAFRGILEYRTGEGLPLTVGLLQDYVPNQGDAWGYTLGTLDTCFESILARPEEFRDLAHWAPQLLDTDLHDQQPLLTETIGEFFLEMIQLLGRRTAELHIALASVRSDPDFVPERFSALYQRSVYQSIREQVRRTLLALRRNLDGLPEYVREEAAETVKAEAEILRRIRRLTEGVIDSCKIRIHGDFHLGQVLFTGKDFMIIDFEGEPARPFSERRLKRSPFRDVAGMIRSFDYAVSTSCRKRIVLHPELAPILEPLLDPLYRALSSVFLHAYLERAGNAEFIPSDRSRIEKLLEAFLLEKALYEIRYELDNRPEWILTPLKGIRNILERGV